MIIGYQLVAYFFVAVARYSVVFIGSYAIV